jgi:hypothetical protein
VIKVAISPLTAAADGGGEVFTRGGEDTPTTAEGPSEKWNHPHLEAPTAPSAQAAPALAPALEEVEVAAEDVELPGSQAT